ncbi:trimethylamine methyltransferase family protein [Ruegeria sp. Ofav3-42]|uniref:trimethylamine methyltransferase family protein n=1 Tax=Ruegeria sp. Ofav3-42 TaxID=2917759 RepID=UPI001EF5253E|nr:trimethylamine methyltransferase family protein [Ruegeria sp. Ofav3-42]MCG7521390.1 trimethylamine methyltransferase family protein [Ruegeria sp. Ofav3-42]
MARNTTRRSGRQERMAARAAKGALAAPFTIRKIGKVSLIDDEAVAIIERNADRILDEIGMEFRGDPETLELFKANGARVEGERVRFDPGWCRDRIRTAPSVFTQHARNPARSVQIGGDAQVYAPSFGPPFVHDMENGRRYATIEDFRNITKLHHQLGAINHSGGVVVEPVDVPVPVRHLHMAHTHLTMNDKPLMGAVTAPERARDTIEMCRIAMGREFVDKNCVLYSVVNTNAPLVMDETMLWALKEYAQAGQCTVVSPFVLGGAMSPVSVAATLSQVLAEVMASVALIQLIRPGVPAAFGTFFSPISLRTGAPTFGTPEGTQFQMCAKTLADRLGLPFHSVGGLTASKVPDAQAGYESQAQLMGAAMAGVNFIIHATGCLEGLLTTGYEKIVMDADRCSAMQRFVGGVDFSEAAQAMDAFFEVEPGGHFLGAQHTQDNFESAFWMGEMSDNGTYEQWHAEGGLWQHERASARVRKLIDEYEAPAMDAGIREELDDFVARRSREIEGDDT